MNSQEFKRYWSPARDWYIGQVMEDNPSISPLVASQLLAKKLGIVYPEWGYWKQITLTPELKNILLAMIGPHGKTMLKIYQIKKGIK